MLDSADFLLELGLEELPTFSVQPLAQALQRGFTAALAECGLSYQAMRAYASPRRVALQIDQLACRCPDQRIERQGPFVQAAFNDQGPTPAATGFARSCGVSVDALSRITTEKGERLAYTVLREGDVTSNMLPKLISQVVQGLPMAKPMRWGMGEHQFVRPLHWLVVLLGRDVIDMTLFGIKSGALSVGHRVHAPEPLPIKAVSDYATLLREQGFVLADFAERRAEIEQRLLHCAAQTKAEVLPNYETLLDEVTGLVEWPVAHVGHFDARFLALPKAVLVAVLQKHQKAFPLQDAEGRLKNRFVFIANLQSDGPTAVIDGNEKVMTARLSDAEFFYEADQKQRLAARNETLKSIIFQEKLGSVWDKVQRVMALSILLAEHLDADQDIAQRAAALCKSDLTTDMVGEFPELQGVMGRAYAIHDGEPIAVASAIEEHYYPRFSGDALPSTPEAACVALADRIDTIVGIFAAGLKPSGDKDPFALRRAALGIIRMIHAQGVHCDLQTLFEQAAQGFSELAFDTSVVTEALTFVSERLRAWHLEHGVPADVLAAVLAKQPRDVQDCALRIAAVREVMASPAACALAAADKRVRNILAKQAQVAGNVQAGLLHQPEEEALFSEQAAAAKEVDEACQARDYSAALQAMVGLEAPLADFFTAVMVNCEDRALRDNRLALLQSVHSVLSRVADLSCLSRGA